MTTLPLDPAVAAGEMPAVAPAEMPALAPAQPSPAPAREARFLYLDQEAMVACGVLDMPLAMRAVGGALLAWGLGAARQPPKVVLRAGDDAACEAQWRINGLCAALGAPLESLGMKWIASFPPNRGRGLPRASGVLILNSPDTGLPLAIMDATLLSAMRTGAVTALGLERLAPRRARRAVVIGAGVQARTQVLALVTACPGLEHIALVNRDPERGARCAADCLREWGAPVEALPPAASARAQALATADIVITATTAQQPVLFADEVAPGALTVQLAGHECDFALVEACDTIVCDDWETILHRGIPTLARMHAAGRLPEARIHANLPQLLSGARRGRRDERERIHFAHIGLGLDDVALGAAMLERARLRGLGVPLPLWREPRWV